MIIVDTIPSNLSMLMIMIHFYRFSILIMTVTIGFLILWFGLRTYGMTRKTSTYQTPLVKKLTKLHSSHQWGELYDNSQKEDGHYAKAFFADDQWLIEGPSGNTTLEKALSNHPDGHLIIYVSLKETRNAAAFKKIIDSGEHGKRIIFTSDVDSTIAVFREMSPKWTFANGPLFILRLITLSSLGLESLVDIPSDVLLLHTSNYKPNLEFASIIELAKKQNKYVLIGPVTSPLVELDPHGWITKAPE